MKFKEATTEIMGMMQTEAGRQKLSQIFNCSEITDDPFIQSSFYFQITLGYDIDLVIIDYYFRIVQYLQEQNPPDWPLTKVCNDTINGGKR